MACWSEYTGLLALACWPTVAGTGGTGPTCASWGAAQNLVAVWSLRGWGEGSGVLWGGGVVEGLG